MLENFSRRLLRISFSSDDDVKFTDDVRLVSVVLMTSSSGICDVAVTVSIVSPSGMAVCVGGGLVVVVVGTVPVVDVAAVLGLGDETGADIELLK